MKMRTLMPCALALVAWPCHATVIEFDDNRNDWLATAGAFTRVDFTGYASNTIITTQYQSLGVTFTDGTDRIHLSNAYPNDLSGLYGASDEIHVSFAQPMHTLAVDYPGSMKFKLYWQGQLTYTSSDFLNSGSGSFAGLISDQPFDAAVILDPTGGVFIDDLYFGQPIPAPGALGLLFGASLLRVSRRRRHRWMM
jgi:hypothetical protein